MDAFVNVLGQGRGVGPEHTLLAAAPSARARQDLAEMLSDHSYENLERICALLEHHRAIVAERPLLSTLLDAAASRHVHWAFEANCRTLLCMLSALGLRTGEPNEPAPHPTVENARQKAWADSGEVAACITAFRGRLADSMRERAMAVMVAQMSAVGGRALFAASRTGLRELISHAYLDEGGAVSLKALRELDGALATLGPCQCQELVGAALSEIVGTGIIGYERALAALAQPIARAFGQLPGSQAQARDLAIRERVDALGEWSTT